MKEVERKDVESVPGGEMGVVVVDVGVVRPFPIVPEYPQEPMLPVTPLNQRL